MAIDLATQSVLWKTTPAEGCFVRASLTTPRSSSKRLGVSVVELATALRIVDVRRERITYSAFVPGQSRAFLVGQTVWREMAVLTRRSSTSTSRARLQQRQPTSSLRGAYRRRAERR